MRFSLPSIIIIAITSNESWKTKTHKTDQNPPVTNHDKVKFWAQLFERWIARMQLNIEYRVLIRWIVIYQVDIAIQRLNNRHLFPKMSAKMIDGSKSANVSWLLNLRTRLFLKSTVNECPLRELPLYNIFVHNTVTCMKPNIFDLSY